VTARLPAEWEPQQAVWFVWPRDVTTWPGGRITGARNAIAHAIRAIAPQQARIVVHPDVVVGARRALEGAKNVRIFQVEHVDSWIRDYGPIIVQTDNGRLAKKFRFDAWGRKYETLMADDDVVNRLGPEALGCPIDEVDFVLEGGAIDTNGEGTFLITRSVARERGQTSPQLEHILTAHLGAKRIIWLPGGVEGDDTDGHVDTVARFVGNNTVVASVALAGHPDYASLKANRDALIDHGLCVIDLPVPAIHSTDDGIVLPAGHANFLIANEVVLVPGFGGPSDSEAMRIIGGATGRRPVLIDHSDLIWGFGGIHCLTMQIPE
jgi:agmatine deiminase